MVDVFKRKNGCVIGTQTVAMEDSDKYGMVAGPRLEDNLACVDQIVEKPSPAEAPSDQAVVGRYILTPEIFNKLKTTERGAGNEIQLVGYLEANVEIALQHEEMADEFKKYLRNLNLD